MRKLNEQQFIASLSEVYCRIGVASHGVGVVAIRTIPKGIDPFEHCDLFGDVLRVRESELEAANVPEEAKDMVRDFCALQDGVYFVPDYGIDAIDKSYFMNHSREPNMISSDTGETFVAVRDIERGEELTADYRLYHETRRFNLD